MPRPLLVAAVVVVATLGVAGCADDPSSSASTADGTTTVTNDPMQDYQDAANAACRKEQVVIATAPSPDAESGESLKRYFDVVIPPIRQLSVAIGVLTPPPDQRATHRRLVKALRERARLSVAMRAVGLRAADGSRLRAMRPYEVLLATVEKRAGKAEQELGLSVCLGETPEPLLST